MTTQLHLIIIINDIKSLWVYEPESIVVDKRYVSGNTAGVWSKVLIGFTLCTLILYSTGAGNYILALGLRTKQVYLNRKTAK